MIIMKNMYNINIAPHMPLSIVCVVIVSAASPSVNRCCREENATVHIVTP